MRSRRWNPWLLWLTIASSATVVFLLSAIGTWWTGDRADFPSWLEAVATVAAVLAAVAAAWYAGHAFLLDRERDEQRQAELVTAWADVERSGAVGAGVWLAQIDKVTLHVRNSSAAAIFRVELTGEIAFFLAGQKVRSERIGYTPGSIAPEDSKWLRFEHPCLPPVPARIMPDGEIEDHTVEVLLQLRFTDAGSRRWHRSADGRLVKLRD